MTLLTDLPKEERPRERLILMGAEALSLVELLAICLGKGRRGCSALQLAEELLSSFGSLCSLVKATLSQLMEIKGIGMTKASQIKATFALAQKIPKKSGIAHLTINHPKDVYHFISAYLEEEKQEKIALIMRDVRGHIFHHEIIFLGTSSEVMIHPKEIFHLLLIHRSHSFILVHNHPSGHPFPSEKDKEITKLVETSGNMLGIPLDDHLIISRSLYFSFWEHQLIKRLKY